jgi:maltose O-acetyltransferase
MIVRTALAIYRRFVFALGYLLIGPHRLGDTTRHALQSVRFRTVRASLKTCGLATSIQYPVCFTSPEKIEFGDNSSVAAYVHIWGAGGVRIGSRVMIGTHTSISSVTHDYRSDAMWQTIVTKPVVIEDDVWIGSNVVILPGVSIGKGAVVGAGAVVTRDVAPSAIVIGVPARMHGSRECSTK